MSGELPKDILEKYSKKLESQLGTFNADESAEENYSEEYERFRAEMVPELTRYERWANSLGNIIKIKVSEKDRVKVQRYLEIAHLNVTPSQALTLSLLSMLAIFFAAVLFAVAIYFISYPAGVVGMSFAQLSDLVLFVFLGLIASMFVFYYTFTMPKRLANTWRLQASAQMVPA